MNKNISKDKDYIHHGVEKSRLGEWTTRCGAVNTPPTCREEAWSLSLFSWIGEEMSSRAALLTYVMERTKPEVLVPMSPKLTQYSTKIGKQHHEDLKDPLHTYNNNQVYHFREIQSTCTTKTEVRNTYHLGKATKLHLTASSQSQHLEQEVKFKCT